MAWYKTGTVTVTNGSVTVTGAGTAFVGAVLAGHGFAGPDGRIYEIATVVSATGLTLASPYLGATAAGAPYGIFPTSGALTPFATRLDTALTGMQSVIDGAGQGKFGAGTPAAPGLRFTADGDTGFTNPAANQIGMVTGGVLRALLSNTALNLSVPVTGTAVTQTATDTTAGRLVKTGDFGLGTAITLGSGDDLNALTATGFYYNSTVANTPGNNYPITAAGSLLNIRRSATNWTQRFSSYAGDSSAAQARIFERSYGGSGWSPWVEVFHQGTIVGTVSQTAGVPTGRVIERGSNANGDYVRFADGTQICWRKVTHDLSLTTIQPWTYPATFIAQPVGGVSPNNSTDAATWVSKSGTGVAHDTSIWRTRTPGAGGMGTIEVHLQAIGRWF
jgi:hypothetical protein